MQSVIISHTIDCGLFLLNGAMVEEQTHEAVASIPVDDLGCLSGLIDLWHVAVHTRLQIQWQEYMLVPADVSARHSTIDV